MKTARITVLYVDDEENNLFAFKATFRSKYEILTALNAQTAFELLAAHAVQIVLADQRMPGLNGVDFLADVNNRYPEIVGIIITGYSDMPQLTEAVKNKKIFQFLEKPWRTEAIEEVIASGYDHYLERTR